MEAKSTLRELYRKKHLYVYLLPTFSLLFVFGYLPPVSALYHAFFRWDYVTSVFVGLDNFKEMLDDTILRISTVNLLKLLAFSVIRNLTVPILVAELIFSLRNKMASYIYRVLLVAPLVVPGIVMLLLWQFIYDGNVGLLNAIIRQLGLGFLERAWLGDLRTALYAIMFVGFPWVAGVEVLIYLAGLQAIPDSIFDVAKLDGATGLTRFLKIDLALIAGQIKLILIFTLIGGIQSFGGILIMTNGGPGFATMVPGLHMYQNAFSYNALGYASAIGLAMFVVILVLTIISMKYIKTGTEF